MTKKSKKDNFPSFSFYVRDWLSSPTVGLMSYEGRAAYIDLLAVAWESDPVGTIPNRPDELWKLCRMTPDAWEQCKVEVLACFEVCEGAAHRLQNTRLREQYFKLKKFTKKASKTASARGKKGAEARWGDSEEGENPNDTAETSAADGMAEG